MKPQTRGYLNEFDDAVPPQELRDVRDVESGVISRVWNGTRHGWTFKCFGALSRTSRALLNSLGFQYQSRKWTRWDADVSPTGSTLPAAKPVDLTGPQRVALFFLRDKTATGGAYAGSIRRQVKLTTLRALYRLGLVEGSQGEAFQEGTYVAITPRGRTAILNLPRPARSGT